MFIETRLEQRQSTFIFLVVKVIFIRKIFCIFFNGTIQLPLCCIKKVGIFFPLFFNIDITFMLYLRFSVPKHKCFEGFVYNFYSPIFMLLVFNHMSWYISSASSKVFQSLVQWKNLCTVPCYVFPFFLQWRNHKCLKM